VRAVNDAHIFILPYLRILTEELKKLIKSSLLNLYQLISIGIAWRFIYWLKLLWMNKSLSSSAISRGGFPDNAVAIGRSATCNSPHSIARDAALRWRTEREGSASRVLAINAAAWVSCSKAWRVNCAACSVAPLKRATAATSAKSIACWWSA